MSLKDLLNHFSGRDNFPVRVDDVKDWLIDNHYQDEIHFYPISDMNSGILRGELKQYTYQGKVYGDPLWVSQICYSQDQSRCWQRLTCCKEMMHILDSPDEKTSTKEEINNLTFDLVAPSSGVSYPAIEADRSATIKALCVLAPIKVIDQLKGAYDNKAKSPYDIAAFLKLPEHYIDFLFSKKYSDIYNKHADISADIVNISS